jgi:hypothetical protein
MELATAGWIESDLAVVHFKTEGGAATVMALPPGAFTWASEHQPELVEAFDAAAARVGVTAARWRRPGRRLRRRGR